LKDRNAHGGPAPNAMVMSIYNQAQTPDDLCVDDLSPKARFKTSRSATALFMQQLKRDSVVLDSCFEVRSPCFVLSARSEYQVTLS
jgi:hypothetical protein